MACKLPRALQGCALTGHHTLYCGERSRRDLITSVWLASMSVTKLRHCVIQIAALSVLYCVRLWNNPSRQFVKVGILTSWSELIHILTSYRLALRPGLSPIVSNLQIMLGGGDALNPARAAPVFFNAIRMLLVDFSIKLVPHDTIPRSGLIVTATMM